MRNLYLVATGILLAHAESPSFAQQPGDTRERVVRTYERPTRNVLKKIGGKSYSCIGKSVVRVYARMTYQCSSYRRAPFCDGPGPSRAYCPSSCSNGRWVTTGNWEEVVREVVTDCNPLGPASPMR